MKPQITTLYENWELDGRDHIVQVAISSALPQYLYVRFVRPISQAWFAGFLLLGLN